ncbi:hypothetical protein COL23_25725 [Priestia aryabhattai]|uniref:hypothetical protein n=1 Tax=Priestia aryabhattai TaxID=412384 RepID=UPI000BF99BB7|nr:hypothetical protein [Priestia aryabhattai]PFW72153.1 hypothetical protein COL23_25725 [Priestia aryabhattai]
MEMWKNFKERLQVITGKFKTVNKTLAKLLVIAILWVIIYDFILVDIPEWFPKASVIGLLTRNLCFAFMTGFIFYFVNTHLSGHKTKVKTYRYVANKVSTLDNMSINLILSIKHTLSLQNSGYEVPSRDDVSHWCKQIPNHIPVSFRVMAYTNIFPNWFKLFEFIDTETIKNVKDLLTLRDSLDSETLRLITNIENCTTTFLNMSKGVPFNTQNNSLEFWDLHIYEYRKMCNQLVTHLKKEYKVYEDEYHYLERKEKRA